MSSKRCAGPGCSKTVKAGRKFCSRTCVLAAGRSVARKRRSQGKPYKRTEQARQGGSSRVVDGTYETGRRRTRQPATPENEPPATPAKPRRSRTRQPATPVKRRRPRTRQPATPDKPPARWARVAGKIMGLSG